MPARKRQRGSDELLSAVKEFLGDIKAVRKALASKDVDVNARDSGHPGDTVLMIAVAQTNPACVKLLIDKGADVNARNSDGYTALMSAVYHELDLRVAKLLLERGADVNARTNEGLTALHSAASYCNECAAKMLLERGADVNARNNQGYTALMLSKCEKLTKLLLDNGADVNARNNEGYTTLQLSARSPDKRRRPGSDDMRKIAQHLIEKENERILNARDLTGCTALKLIADGDQSSGSQSFAEFLLEEGASVNARDDNGTTPLMGAALHNHGDLAKLLLKYRASVDARDDTGGTALMIAGEHGRMSIAQLLLDKGADVNAWDVHHATALMFAAQNGHEYVAKLLLDKGADVNARDTHGATALTTAATEGHEPIVKLLLDSGADVNACDNKGQTSLWGGIQCQWDDLNIGTDAVSLVKLLLDKGADVNHVDKYGRTPLMYAASGHDLYDPCERVIKVLIDRGADINTRDAAGRTPLMWAARDGNEVVFHTLIAAGSDPALAGDDGKTPLQVLIEKLKNANKNDEHAKSVQQLIDEKKEEIPDGLYLELCSVNKKAFDHAKKRRR